MTRSAATAGPRPWGGYPGRVAPPLVISPLAAGPPQASGRWCGSPRRERRSRKTASGGLGKFGHSKADVDPRHACVSGVKSAEGVTYTVMDTLSYGLSSPQLALMGDGNVFVAGQVQAPMNPPVVSTPQSDQLERSGRVVEADSVPAQATQVGSCAYGTIYIHKAITVTGHTVNPLSTYRHASVRITPTNQTKWLNDKTWGSLFFLTGPDQGGYRYIALSGYPSGGMLTKQVDRPSDVGIQSDRVECGDLSTYLSQSEDDLILQLLNAFNAYQNNYSYTMIADQPGLYNSNSFAHGLLNAAGFSNVLVDSESLFVGWQNPLPASAFGQ